MHGCCGVLQGLLTACVAAIAWNVAVTGAPADTIGASMLAQPTTEEWRECDEYGYGLADCLYMHPFGASTTGVLTRVVVRSLAAGSATPMLIRGDGARLTAHPLVRDAPSYQLLEQGALDPGDTTFPVRHRVVPGDRLAVRTDHAPAFIGPHIGRITEIVAPGDDGALEAYPLVPGEPLVQGVVEPDADGDGYGDVSQDRCPEFDRWRTPCPHMVMSTSASRRTTVPGTAVTFTTTVRNHGSAASRTGGVRLELQPAVARATVTPSAGTCTATFPVRCEIPPLAQWGTVTITTRVPALRGDTALKTELLLPDGAWARQQEAYNTAPVHVPSRDQLKVGVRVLRRWKPRVILECGKGGGERCSGKVALVRAGRTGPRTLSRTSRFSISPGGRSTVTLRLTRPAAIRRRRGALRTLVVVTRTGLPTGPAVATTRLRIPRDVR